MSNPRHSGPKDPLIEELSPRTLLKDRIAEIKRNPIPKEGVTPDDHFMCVECQHVHPNAEVGLRRGFRGTFRICKSCVSKGPKKPHRPTKYNLNRLPKWMHS